MSIDGIIDHLRFRGLPMVHQAEFIAEKLGGDAKAVREICEGDQYCVKLNLYFACLIAKKLEGGE